MFVMRKLDHELALVLRFHSLVRIVGIAKRKPYIFARRGADMTNGANGGTGADDCLAREELLAMATNTRVMIGKVSDVRKVPFGSPDGGDLMAVIATEAFVLFREMKERGIF